MASQIDTIEAFEECYPSEGLSIDELSGWLEANEDYDSGKITASEYWELLKAYVQAI